MFRIEYRKEGEQFGFGTEFRTLEEAVKFAKETPGRVRVCESDGICMIQLMIFKDGFLIAMSVRVGNRMEQIMNIDGEVAR
jgi:hypothetical protein